MCYELWSNFTGNLSKSAKLRLDEVKKIEQSKKRRHYPELYKKEAVLLVTEHGYNIAQASVNVRSDLS